MAEVRPFRAVTMAADTSLAVVAAGTPLVAVAAGEPLAVVAPDMGLSVVVDNLQVVEVDRLHLVADIVVADHEWYAVGCDTMCYLQQNKMKIVITIIIYNILKAVSQRYHA